MKRKVSARGAVAAVALLAATASGIVLTRQSSADNSFSVSKVQTGAVSFKLSTKDVASGLAFEDECPGKVCTCDADVDKVQLNSNDAASLRINQSLASHAAPFCAVSLQGSTSASRVTFINNDFVSVVSDQLALQRGAGGSCHGKTVAETYDRQSGAELQLKDVVKPADLPAVASILAKSIITEQMRKDPEPFISEAELAKGLTEKNGKLGLFIDNGKLMVQVDQFLFSCADGHSFPAQLPTQFVTNDRLRNLLSASKVAP
ncbi:MAG: hypothetical protein KBA75_06945 [Alphaproteobacteria bacterium]|nr:hypothetical protein [Alphaproteobacteria bacterium]